MFQKCDLGTLMRFADWSISSNCPYTKFNFECVADNFRFGRKNSHYYNNIGLQLQNYDQRDALVIRVENGTYVYEAVESCVNGTLVHVIQLILRVSSNHVTTPSI